MIEKINISNYKCIDHVELDLKPLTVVTGLNSTGKSTLLQAILLPDAVGPYGIPGISTTFDIIRCKNINEEKIIIKITDGQELQQLELQPNIGPTFSGAIDFHPYGKSKYYLSANRSIGDTVSSKKPGETAISPYGLDAFATFEQEKNKPIIDKLIRDDGKGKMLSVQVNLWLNYILDLQGLKLSTSLAGSQERVDISYTSDDIDNITPSNLGTGVTFLAEMLITCLRAKEGDIVLIENPEIHLHPKAQSKVGKFLAFVANAGVQVIVETHCEHMINKIRYEVYKKHISNKDVVIYYKSGVSEPYEEIGLNERGNYCRNGEENMPFPSGFFDATLKELRLL